MSGTKLRERIPRGKYLAPAQFPAQLKFWIRPMGMQGFEKGAGRLEGTVRISQSASCLQL